MSKHKYTTLLCSMIIAAMLLATSLFMFGETFGLHVAASSMPYENRLFATDKVHTLDVVVDASEWEDILENAQEKEYIAATIVIDGESFKNVAIRTKGNSSLSSIANTDSDRYSFKIEFDHYDTSKTYYGLDKLALNNVTQDNTYLKDYVSYQMMGAFDADAPLSSFVWITINGEDWGLYLAVEGIEDAFAERNYGTTAGILYKPDSMDMNANAGNAIGGNNGGEKTNEWQNMIPDGTAGAGIPEGTRPTMPNRDQATEGQSFPGRVPTDGQDIGGKGGMGGAGSNDVALVYSDDSYDSYSNIFDSAKSDITSADKDRLIASLKTLSTGENLETVVNIEEVLRYFVVHNFVLNFDSYTGSMMHNYYLYEEDGILSMIAWDYNLAFGGFGSTGSGSSATAMVNYPIDSPTSGVTLESRPMLGQLLASYEDEYHALFAEFIEEYFESGEFLMMINDAIDLISPYVEKDPTAFATYAEFQSASDALREFCLLRAESVAGQLDGSIPSTSEGQATDASALIDASQVNMSGMGSNSFGKGRTTEAGQQVRPQSNVGGSDDDDLKSSVSTTETNDVAVLPMSSDVTSTIVSLSATTNGAPSTDTVPRGEAPAGNVPSGAGNVPPGKDGMGVPGATPPVSTTNATDGSNVPDATVPSEGEKGSVDTGTLPSDQTTDAKNPFGEMPTGNFGQTIPNQTNATQNNAVAYIWLAFSILLIGLGNLFAYKFKR